MRKLFTILSSVMLLSTAGFAFAAGQQDMPTPPTQSAEPHKTTPPTGGDYLEQQPDQNNATTRDGSGNKQQDRKVKQPGKSHQKQPDGGGVEVK